MAILRLIIAALFLFMAVGIILRFLQVRRPGLLLGALAYGGAAVLSFALESWWPILGGFVLAWLFGRLGADPPTDLRLDLPTLDQTEAHDPQRRRSYLEQWLAQDTQVALVNSAFVRDAWLKGYRQPTHVPAANAWSLPTSTAAWVELTTSDLIRLASLSRSDALRYLDSINDLSTPTIMEAGEITVEYSLPSLPQSVEAIEKQIRDVDKRTRYLTAYVGDAILAGRLRVLAWTYQQWHGERYVQAHQRSGT